MLGMCNVADFRGLVSCLGCSAARWLFLGEGFRASWNC